MRRAFIGVCGVAAIVLAHAPAAARRNGGIGKGEEVKSIAKMLHLSPKTIETHRTHIKEKLRLKNAREVARYAVQWISGGGA